LFAVLKIAKNARAVAKKQGREQIQLDDLEQGIALAGINLPQAAASPAATAASAKPGRKPANPIAVKRGTRPVIASAPAREAAPQILEAPAVRETTLTVQPA
jgi:hypothetical protein